VAKTTVCTSCNSAAPSTDILPVPLFETLNRFKNLDLETFDVELPDVRDFLESHDDATGSIASYEAVRLFLSRYPNESTYISQRNNIEKLLSWAICVVRKPLTLLSPNDIEDFFNFCSAPPQSWLSLKPEKRFTRTGGRKYLSQATYVINTAWRPFISTSLQTDESSDSSPAVDSKDHIYAPVSVSALALACRTFFLFLATEDLITENPMREINRSARYVRSRENYERQTVFSALEWEYLNRAIDHLTTENHRHERTRFIVMSIYHLHLRSSDFQKFSRTLKMRDFFCDDAGRVWLALDTPSAKRQVISVNSEYLDVHLPRYRRYLGIDSVQLGCDPTPLFASHGGRAGLSVRYVNAVFHEVLDVAARCMAADGIPEDQIAGLKSGSIKWLRHTSAQLKSASTAASELNVDLRITNAQSTEDRYYKGRIITRYVHPNEQGRLLTG
jgi:integrase